MSGKSRTLGINKPITIFRSPQKILCNGTGVYTDAVEVFRKNLEPLHVLISIILVIQLFGSCTLDPEKIPVMEGFLYCNFLMQH